MPPRVVRERLEVVGRAPGYRGEEPTRCARDGSRTPAGLTRPSLRCWFELPAGITSSGGEAYGVNRPTPRAARGGGSVVMWGRLHSFLPHGLFGRPLRIRF